MTRLATGISAATTELAVVIAASTAAVIVDGGEQSATSPNNPGVHIAVTASAAAVAMLLAIVPNTSPAVDIDAEEESVEVIEETVAVVLINEGVHP